jgi:hypothetical protein
MHYSTAKKFAILGSDLFMLNMTMRAASTLALLVARILADHPHHPLAAHDLAVAADSLHGCQHFHCRSSECSKWGIGNRELSDHAPRQSFTISHFPFTISPYYLARNTMRPRVKS